MSMAGHSENIESHSGPGTARLLDDVAEALSRHASIDVFAIGGSVKASGPAAENFEGQNKIAIRWDSANDQDGHKVVLPVGDEVGASQAFQQLLDDCQPATFGKGGEDVLDEEYRKAGKMDASRFSTSFNLAEHAIMDTLTQALVQSSFDGIERNGVRAELYKLNIYSGPSGKFKPHVDTPRSESQMGSLVVCLPYAHEGGALRVRHAGQEVLYDWSSKHPDSVQWAAFFSDCEHEVLQVTGGHRISLTYNLHWTSYGPALMATELSALDQPSLHFYNALQNLVRSPEFLPEGGLVGFSCTHGYPHASENAIPQIHSALKGLDMVVYQALKRLTGSSQVLAVVNQSRQEEEESFVNSLGMDERKIAQERKSIERQKSWVQQTEQTSSRASQEHARRELDSANEWLEVLQERARNWQEKYKEWQARRNRQTSEVSLSDILYPALKHEGYEDDERLNPNDIDLSYTWSRNGGFDNGYAFRNRKVSWLNHSPVSFKEMAVAFVTYGNEACVDMYYSAAVIISEIPPYDKRAA